MEFAKVTEKMIKVLGIDREEFVWFFDWYCQNIATHTNDIYDELMTCLAHLETFSRPNWFNQRFDLYIELLPNYRRVVDFGYSIPYPLIWAYRNCIILNTQCIFIDKSYAALDFAMSFVAMTGQHAIFFTGDICENRIFRQLKAITEKDENVLIIAVETIEHLREPEKFWHNLQMFKNCDILVTLPIGPKILSHHLYFNNKWEVYEYLRSYIDIQTFRFISSGSTHPQAYHTTAVFGNIK